MAFATIAAVGKKTNEKLAYMDFRRVLFKTIYTVYSGI